MDAYCIIHHMSEYIRRLDTFVLTCDVLQWATKLEKKNNGDCRDVITRLQLKLLDIINKVFIEGKGAFHIGVASRHEVKARMEQHGDYRLFNTVGGIC